MDTANDPGRRRRPGTLMLHLLGRCNLTCRHCYMDGSPARREELPLAPVLAAIGECEALDIGTLYLSGGEPLLYLGIEQALAAAARVPGLEITVSTNAVLLTRKRAALIAQAGARINVSIDGEPEYHDHFRGLAGAFQASQKGICRAVDSGIRVTVISTISQGNLGSLRWLAEWAAQIGAAEFRVQPLLKLGRGVEIADQRLTAEQTRSMLLQLSDLANTYRRRGLKCSLVGVSRDFLRAHPCGAYVCNGAGCHRRMAKEIKKIVVREDGTVLPEMTNLAPAFALGNICEDRLSNLVSRYFEDGYDNFDQLCRTTYADILPSWDSPVVPWDQIVADRSYSWNAVDPATAAAAAPACSMCSPPHAAARRHREDQRPPLQ